MRAGLGAPISPRTVRLPALRVAASLPTRALFEGRGRGVGSEAMCLQVGRTLQRPGLGGAVVHHLRVGPTLHCVGNQRQKNLSRRLPKGFVVQCRAGGVGDFASEDLPTWWDPAKLKSRQEARGVESLLIKRSIRQYEELKHSGSLVIVGNVAAGAVVSAGGDVIVLGRLAGKAYAGEAGDPSSVVIALVMEPSAVSINQRLFAGPEGPASPYPEVASLTPAGSICIEPLGSVSPGSGAAATLDPVMAELAKKHVLDVRWTVEGTTGRKLSWGTPAMASAITGLYIMLAGIVSLIAPLHTFGLLLNVHNLTRGWMRMISILATVFGLYYIGATLGDISGYGAKGFYAATIVGRLFIFLSFCILVAAGDLPVSILALAVLNFIGAISMLLSLQK